MHYSLNPVDTVFEILDKCVETNGRTDSGSDLVDMIKSDLKEKLESWSDPQPDSESLKQQVVQHSEIDVSIGKRTNGDTLAYQRLLSLFKLIIW